MRGGSHVLQPSLEYQVREPGHADRQRAGSWTDTTAELCVACCPGGSHGSAPFSCHLFPNGETKAGTIRATRQNSSQLEAPQGLKRGADPPGQALSSAPPASSLTVCPSHHAGMVLGTLFVGGSLVAGQQLKGGDLMSFLVASQTVQR